MWEFEIVCMADESQFKDRLNELSADNWELIYVASHYVYYHLHAGYSGSAGGGGGNSGNPSGYTKWNAALKRKKEDV